VDGVTHPTALAGPRGLRRRTHLRLVEDVVRMVRAHSGEPATTGEHARTVNAAAYPAEPPSFTRPSVVFAGAESYA